MVFRVTESSSSHTERRHCGRYHTDWRGSAGSTGLTAQRRGPRSDGRAWAYILYEAPGTGRFRARQRQLWAARRDQAVQAAHCNGGPQQRRGQPSRRSAAAAGRQMHASVCHVSAGVPHGAHASALKRSSSSGCWARDSCAAAAAGAQQQRGSRSRRGARARRAASASLGRRTQPAAPHRHRSGCRGRPNSSAAGTVRASPAPGSRAARGRRALPSPLQQRRPPQPGLCAQMMIKKRNY